jgi:hypothetical protein
VRASIALSSAFVDADPQPCTCTNSQRSSTVLSSEFADVDSIEASDLEDTRIQNIQQELSDDYRLRWCDSSQIENEAVLDAPSDNLLAQLLLSEPSVPMLADEAAFEQLSRNVSSMVTPRQPTASGQSNSCASRNASAPLGIGCLNLSKLEKRSPEHKKDVENDTCLQGQLASFVTARKPLAHESHRSSGSVAAVRWGGVDAVEWMDFVTHEDLSEHSDIPSSSNLSDTKVRKGHEFVLERGETIQVLRGCMEGVGEVLADWIVLVTSKLRSRKIGNAQGSLPTFSFIAAPGFEISGVVKGSDGRIKDVRQARL